MQDQKISMNLEMIKKNILYDALAFNLQEEKQKRTKKQQQRLEELEYFANVNRRVSTQVQMERQTQKRKKMSKQRALAQQYEKQMEEKKKAKELQIKINRTYGQLEQKNQQHYHNRRSHQISKIYRKQGFNSFNPLERKRDEEQGRRLETEPLNYKDYLEKEISRRKEQRQSQKRSIKQRQKIFMERLSKEVENEAKEERFQARKQKLSYKNGLDEQVARKRIK